MQNNLSYGEDITHGFSKLLRSYFSFPMGWTADQHLLTLAEQRAFGEIARSTHDDSPTAAGKQRLRACLWHGTGTHSSWLWLACGPAKPGKVG